MAGPDRPHMQHSQHESLRRLSAGRQHAAASLIAVASQASTAATALAEFLVAPSSDCTHTASQGENATARLTAGPGAASGTFNPLCKVLCILQSLYFCASGPTLVFHLVMDTHHSSNCSPKPLYSWIPAAAQRRPWRTQGYGTISLSCGPFQGASWRHGHPPHSRRLRSPQHLMKPTVADRCCQGSAVGESRSG